MKHKLLLLASLGLFILLVSFIKDDNDQKLSETEVHGTHTTVWIDADVAVGMKRYTRPGYSDVDDGYAILQLLNNEHINIMGISNVFGNTRIDDAFRITKEIVALSDQDIPVYKGAGEAIDLANVKTNDGVEAMAKALKNHKMKILAIGPATNVGILLLKYPELVDQIQEVILVAGRRSGTDYFEIGDKDYHAADLNFDLDNVAFEVMFEAGVPVTLCPFEISNKVWIKDADLDHLSQGDELSQFMASHSRKWLAQWKTLGEEGFNPFDVLASHYLIAPDDIISEQLNARLEIHKNDLNKIDSVDAYKQFLVCDKAQGYPVKFCYDIAENYHNALMKSLTRK